MRSQPRLRIANAVASYAASLAGAVACLLSTPAEAIFWNNDPSFGVASGTGLTDRPHWFGNVHRIYNGTNNTSGTAMLLDPQWAITVRHVVQNGGNYGAIAPADAIRVDVGGRLFYADEVFTPDGGSEIALLRLRGGVADAIDARSIVNSQFDEAGRIVQIGGYGFRGHFNTTGAGGTQPGSVEGLGSFRRAFNVNFIPGQIRIIADGESTLASRGLLEGTVGSGDSGGPMLGYYGPTRGEDLEASLADPLNWRLIGLAATGSGGAGGESWGGQSNYTRVAAYSGFIQNVLAAGDDPAPATTNPWTVDSGSGFWGSGDRLTFTGSGGPPIAHASFGEGEAGYTLDSIGDQVRFSALLHTDQDISAQQIRYGLFDDASGAIDGAIPGGEAWNGYLIANAVGRGRVGVQEKGANGGGVGTWWGTTGLDTAVTLPGSATSGIGDYSDAGGQLPPGRYSIDLSYMRLSEGLQIDWRMVSVDEEGAPTSFYEHTGSAIDPTPASSNWTYNQAGLFLLDESLQGTVVADDILVRFVEAALPGDFNLDGVVDAADYTTWRDGPGDVFTPADYDVWVNNFGATSADQTAVPVPSVGVLTLVAFVVRGVGGRRGRRAFDTNLTS